MENSPIILERLFNATPAKLWNALTDKNEMKNGILICQNLKLKLDLNFNFPADQVPKKNTYIFVKLRK